ncbi:MAG: KH domain-containing protein [Fervidobacterium sp.]
MKEGGIAAINIERTANALNIVIETSRPGIVIGRGGKGIEDLKKEIIDIVNKSTKRVLSRIRPSLIGTVMDFSFPLLTATIILSS